MSNYATLKAAIQSAVYTNNNNEITGAGLQAVLLQIVNTVGDGYVFKGVATAGTSPGTPDANVFYVAPAGTYTNFGSSYTVPEGSIGVFMYDGSWTKALVATSEVAAYSVDISAAPSAIWHNLPSYVAGKKVLIRADVEQDDVTLTMQGDMATNLGTLFRGSWQFLDFSAYTSVRLYVASPSSQTIKVQIILSETLINEMERVRKIIPLKVGQTTAMESGDYFCRYDGTVIGIHLAPTLDNPAFPTKGVYYKGFTLTEQDLFWCADFFAQYTDGRLSRLPNEAWMGKILKGVTVTGTSYGYIDNNGLAHTGTSEQGNVYTDYIPVLVGMRLHVHAGYFAGTFNNTVYGYKIKQDAVAGGCVALGRTTNGTIQDFIIEITDPNIRYVRMWSSQAASFVGDAGAPFIRVLPPKNTAYDFVVDANGEGDFTNLYQAYRATSYMAEHQSIYVKAGEYEMPKVPHNSEFSANRKLSIIGESKESVIIYNTDGDYHAGEGAVDSAPLRLSGNVTIKNVTIKALSTEYSGSSTPTSYCIHIDFNASDGSIMEVENCRMYNDHYACLGIGLRAGFTLKIRNCELYSKSLPAYEHNAWNGAIICHDGPSAGNPQRIEMYNNLIECTGDHAVSLIPASSNQIDALFIGNAIFAADVPVFKGTPVEIDSRTCLNNITIS